MKRIHLFLIFLLLASLTANLFQYRSKLGLEYQIKELEWGLKDLNELYETSLADYKEQGRSLEETRQELRYAKSNLSDSVSTIEKLNQSLIDSHKTIAELSFSKTVNAEILGVKSAAVGVALPLITELKYGTGKLLIDTTGITLEEDVQDTMKIALFVAQNYTGEKLGNHDVIFHIVNTGDDIISIGGLSASSVMAVSLIAVLQDRQIREDVMITGGIRTDGTITSVTYIREKALAAKKRGANTLLVPVGDKVYVEGINIVEVSDISEAVRWMLD